MTLLHGAIVPAKIEVCVAGDRLIVIVTIFLFLLDLFVFVVNVLLIVVAFPVLFLVPRPGRRVGGEAATLTVHLVVWSSGRVGVDVDVGRFWRSNDPPAATAAASADDGSGRDLRVPVTLDVPLTPRMIQNVGDVGRRVPGVITQRCWGGRGGSRGVDRRRGGASRKAGVSVGKQWQDVRGACPLREGVLLLDSAVGSRGGDGRHRGGRTGLPEGAEVFWMRHLILLALVALRGRRLMLLPLPLLCILLLLITMQVVVEMGLLLLVLVMWVMIPHVRVGQLSVEVNPTVPHPASMALRVNVVVDGVAVVVVVVSVMAFAVSASCQQQFSSIIVVITHIGFSP